MKNSHKNNNKTPQHRSVYRRHPFQFIFIALLVLASLGVVANTLYSNWRDEHNVQVMQSTAAELKADLVRNNPNVVWQDRSHCTVIEPRLFGESTKYSCTSEYDAQTTVGSQSDIDTLFNLQKDTLMDSEKIGSVTVLHHPQFMTDQAIRDLPSYERSPNLVGTVNFLIKGMHPDSGCSLSYELDSQESDHVQMGIALRCSVDTKRTYFNPVETL